ncbi:MAG: DinB family protein [bacterium]|nr:DinB family protein [bacterium]
MNTTVIDCTRILQQGLSLIEALPAEDYAFPEEESVWSSPGAHTRHMLDFVFCLLTGLDARNVDYTARKRRADIENSQEIGIREIRQCIDRLDLLRPLDRNLELDIRTDANQEWVRSTLGRELQFVTAHVVHHHALIRMTLARRGIEAPYEYGVAPSTLAYRAANRSDEGT